MPKTIFLFDGGNYKRGLDDGRVRVPLTPQEAEMVFADPEVPANTDNSIGTELPMQKYAAELCGLAVGDEIFVGLAPDAAFYRGLWMHSYDAVEGFAVDYDLVKVTDVYDAWLAGDASGVAPYAGTLSYDFANGLGNATKDACQLAALWGGVHTDYRNNDAAVFEPINPGLFAKLSEALYMRLTVTAVGSFGSNAEGGSCCSKCGKDAYPTVQVGALYDQLCIDKQRTQVFCNCNEILCGEGCAPSAPATSTTTSTTTTTTSTTTTTAAPTTTTTTAAPTTTTTTAAPTTTTTTAAPTTTTTTAAPTTTTTTAAPTTTTTTP